ncbi:autotransporter domain-containing protein [Pseudomonas sp. F1_0610]|uniref:autotransporter domain-containing protein n=1 Tax=Pseudomonas sp. F1_0610 TaxID=3114284 RepID=UPI0039C3AF47
MFKKWNFVFPLSALAVMSTAYSAAHTLSPNEIYSYGAATGIGFSGGYIAITSADNQVFRAVKDTKGYNLESLQSVVTDKIIYAKANAVSADGSALVGGYAIRKTDPDSVGVYHPAQPEYKTQAYIWDKDHITVIEGFRFPTFPGVPDIFPAYHDTYRDEATAISADKNTVVGNTRFYWTDFWNNSPEEESRAFIWNRATATSSEVGFLNTKDPSITHMSQVATGISADGSKVVGQSRRSSTAERAYLWTVGDATAIDLGTLQANSLTSNTGNSYASAISGDGKTIVGWADNDAGQQIAFHWQVSTGMLALGTLGNDIKSKANAVSDDGKIIVGNSYNAANESSAFYWQKTESANGTMTQLAHLTGQTSSEANAVSKDGKVVVGTSGGRATAWLENKNKPIDIIDHNNSINKVAEDTYRLIDLYRARLSRLSDSRCELGEQNYCIGGFSNYNQTSGNSLDYSGVYSSVRLSQNWQAGLSLDFMLYDSLSSTYRTRSNDLPGLGAFIRYQQNSEQIGFNVDFSLASHSQKLTAYRAKKTNTETGKGSTKLTGKTLNLEVAYGIKLSEQVTVLPTIGVRYIKTERDAYAESQRLQLPVNYSKVAVNETSLKLGSAFEYQASHDMLLYADAGTYIKLHRKHDEFTAQVPYNLGGGFISRGKTQGTQPYINTGVQFAVSPASSVQFDLGWSKEVYKNSTYTLGLGYQYRF